METVKNEHIGINEMTAEVWNLMTKEEQRAWTNYWGRKGMVSFRCLNCGFPTATGQGHCEACRP